MEAGSWADWFSGSMSALAVVVALGGYFISSAQRKADQRSSDETSTRLLATKIVRVASLTADIHQHLHAPHDGPPMDGVGADQKWRRIRGLVGLRDEAGLALDAAQEDMLMRLKENQFLLDLMIAISRYRSLSANMQDYGVKREAIQQLHPAPVLMEGLHAVHHIDGEQLARLMPFALSLEHQLNGLIELADENRDLTRTFFNTYNDFTKKHFPKSQLPKLGEVEPADDAENL